MDRSDRRLTDHRSGLGWRSLRRIRRWNRGHGRRRGRSFCEQHTHCFFRGANGDAGAAGGTAPIGGDAGGNGGNATITGSSGTAPGGGGGGTSGVSGTLTGANGQVTVTYSGGSTVITTKGFTAFTVPAGITSIDVECWGAGASGNQPAPGGGGGAYAKSTLSVTPGDVYYAFVGSGGVGSTSGVTGHIYGTIWDGEPSFFARNLVMAAGGSSPTGNGRAGGAGGAAASSIGTTKFSGGAGGSSSGSNAGGAGGGGSAGPTSNGNAGSSNSTGTGGAGAVAVSSGAQAVPVGIPAFPLRRSRLARPAGAGGMGAVADLLLPQDIRAK